VAIRGDIDALPVTEATGLPYASQHAGIMHACGHDIHAAWAVGAARMLARSPAAGDVLVLFQPAEEIGEGARAVLDSGVLGAARAMFGGHVDGRFTLGQVVAQAGAVAASTDTFRVEFVGRGGHGARPHLTDDSVVAAAEFVLALQTIVSRRLDPGVAGVVTVGSVHGGAAANVIPDRVELLGTIRATTVPSRQLLVTEVGRIAAAVATTHRLQATVDVTGGTPPLENSADATAWAREAVTAVLGPDALVPLGFTNMAGEDFSFYGERMPGCFLRVGARHATDEPRDVHTPTFAPAEEAIFVGAAVLAEAARVASRALASA
jgi:hippurate hydrolase